MQISQLCRRFTRSRKARASGKLQLVRLTRERSDWLIQIVTMTRHTAFDVRACDLLCCRHKRGSLNADALIRPCVGTDKSLFWSMWSECAFPFACKMSQACGHCCICSVALLSSSYSSTDKLCRAETQSNAHVEYSPQTREPKLCLHDRLFWPKTGRPYIDKARSKKQFLTMTLCTPILPEQCIS